MKRLALSALKHCSHLAVGATFVFGASASLVNAQEPAFQVRTDTKTSFAQQLPVTGAQEAYILGPGDAVVVELLDVPEYSGVFTIGPDGTLYLPRLRSLFVEGLTVEELRYFLTQQFSSYVRDPQVFVSPAAYDRSVSTSAARWPGLAITTSPVGSQLWELNPPPRLARSTSPPA